MSSSFGYYILDYIVEFIPNSFYYFNSEKTIQAEIIFLFNALRLFNAEANNNDSRKTEIILISQFLGYLLPPFCIAHFKLLIFFSK